MEALGTLSGGIAHDFNNILGIIVGFTEMACWDMDAASPIRANLQEVLKAAGRAKELVKQILAFSRKSEQEKRPVPVGLIVKETLQMLRASLPTTIHIESKVNISRAVLADPTQIHQVLMNLCANAAHAMRDGGGTLRVSLTDVHFAKGSILPSIDLQPGPHVRLTVEDTGHGIDPAIMDRIFDPFFTTKETGIGTGLGLAVVDGIVRNLGGAIQADSTPGQGTVFHVYFPAVVDIPAAKIELPDSLPTGHERVLLVDDEPALVMATKMILENLGYHVDYRTSSVEALETFRHQPADQPYQLVIADMTMPHLTGADLAKELHRLQPALPIVVCTGFSEKINPETARELGIQGFLMKPVVMQDLAEMVRKVLDERRET
jgi:two-component system, cell cycle sensor histidine kinase and response regulator CckA